MNEILEKFIKEAESNQWAPHLPIPKDIYHSTWPWAPVEFEADFKKMHQECIDNDHLFVGHRQKDRQFSYNHEGWAALTLHGISPTATENYEQYGFKSIREADYHWTEVCDLFPTCAEFLKSLQYYEYDRVRIMKLSAGGYIMPHVDGPGRIFGPLNIAINNPEGCDFYFRKWGKVPFKQGTGNFLDIGNEHIVWNNSDEDRYHFIVHGSPSHYLREYGFKQLTTKLQDNTSSDKRIQVAYGVYNQLDQINNEEMYIRAKSTTLFYLERLNVKMIVNGKEPMSIISKDDVGSILREAVDNNFDYCVVQSAGCQIRNMSFHEDLLEFISENNFGVAGHPLWWDDGRWLELHKQFFIVNLKAYKEIGCPDFGPGTRKKTPVPALERSEENFHHDYTPLWVKPTGKHASYNELPQGWMLLSAMFDGGHSVITLSEKIRLGKFYIYPDHETRQFVNSINTLTTYPDQNWNQNKWIEDCKLVKDQIWLFNSEYMGIPNTSVYDIAVSTASGFKIFDLFKTPRLADNAKIIIYDFNPKSLDWYKHFYTWHNEDLLECIRSFPDRDNFTWVGHFDLTYRENQGFNDGLKTVYDYFGEDNFAKFWKEFKDTTVEFIQLDLYKNPEHLAFLVAGNGKKFINLTNIFSTDATQVIFGNIECMVAQTRCLGYVYTVDPTVDITMFDFWGRHKRGEVRDLL